MPRHKVLICLLLSTAVSVLWGYQIENSRDSGLWDFRAIYFGARTLMDHHNPYQPTQFLDDYFRHGGTIPVEPLRHRNFFRAVPLCVNVPSTLLVVAPLAFLSWGPAHLIWMALMPAGLLLSAWLIWDLAGASSPRLTLLLLCVTLANCEVVLQGNAAGLAVSLCVAAVWSFMKERYKLVGVLCLALALAIKPQEVGFVWLALLLGGGLFRRRALQSAAIAGILAMASVVWVSHVAPHWVHDWRSNLSATTARGDLNDPGPTSIGNSEPGMIVSLQAVISCFRDDPHFYNPATYAICGILFLIWGWTALRVRGRREGVWLAIAAGAALGLLPIYHRQYDCKILFLMIPALAAVRSGVSAKAWKWAVAVTCAAIVLCADVPVAILFMIRNSLHVSMDRLSGQFLTVLLARTPTLVLLLSGTFYVCLLARLAWARHPALEVGGASEREKPETVPAYS